MLQMFWIAIHIKPKFAGWDMVTHAELPWTDIHCPDMKRFRKTAETIKKQFAFGPDLGLNAGNIDVLMWRHYIVTFAVRYALRCNDTKVFNMVEAGVADGISAFFSLREASDNLGNRRFTMHLYDSWSSMRQHELLESEHVQIGRYGGLDMERTKKNLSRFEAHTVYHQGYVPESLHVPPEPPAAVGFIHIDINAAVPTQELLHFFWPKLTDHAVILFDDYGWSGYEEMRDMIDAFFCDKEGLLLKLPTGQAVYFHP